jgi:hypothetical protein
MRMWHYFLVGALILAPALFATLLLGVFFDGTSKHLWAGLFTASVGVGVHTLVILFMLVTGRVLREAIRSRRLAPEMLDELNRFFARKRAYPLAGIGASLLVATGVLGYAAKGFGISPAWHFAVGLLAVVFNLWALKEEYEALRVNQQLIDRAARELDALDRELEARGISLPQVEPQPRLSIRNGWTLAIGAWLPYLYQALIVWRGDFSRVSVHPWLEGSLLGFVVLILAWRARTPSPQG